MRAGRRRHAPPPSGPETRHAVGTARSSPIRPTIAARSTVTSRMPLRFGGAGKARQLGQHRFDGGFARLAPLLRLTKKKARQVTLPGLGLHCC